jgi:hypothetical protein
MRLRAPILMMIGLMIRTPIRSYNEAAAISELLK